MRPHDTSIPEGLCQCGCGGRTNLVRTTEPARGRFKGRPARYINGHQARSGHQNGPVPTKYTVNETTGCWDWQLSTRGKGYGQEWDPTTKRIRVAHILAWERVNGPVPPGMELDHTCRNRGCVNPDHLEPVTSVENTRRGAVPKINAEIAATIRALQGSMTQKQIGEKFGITPQTVGAILLGKTWR